MSKKKLPVEVWNVRQWDTGKLLGQLKDANIDIALFLARKKWGHHVTVDNLHDGKGTK
jgi:hypothetical protein